MILVGTSNFLRDSGSDFCSDRIQARTQTRRVACASCVCACSAYKYTYIYFWELTSFDVTLVGCATTMICVRAHSFGALRCTLCHTSPHLNICDGRSSPCAWV